MSIEAVTATVECDGCGLRFTVSLDSAYTPPAGWTIYDCAVDAVRGGVNNSDEGSSSVQDDCTLCGKCTRWADKEGEEEAP